jgi:hypothetical protein
MPLNARQIDTAKPKEKEYKLTDGGGLYLLIKPNGAKYWRLKYRFLGKEKKLSIGVYPDISLADARLKREEARKVIALGVIREKKRKQKNWLKRPVWKIPSKRLRWNGMSTSVLTGRKVMLKI